MKTCYKVFLVIFTGVLFGCNSQKSTNTHSHDSTVSHSHNHESSVNKENNYFVNYNLNDAEYGTKTIVTISNNNRIMVTNALPNHKTGEFPRKGNPNTISAQQKTYTFPTNPKYTGNPEWVREPGVSLNGVKFEPGTAEVVTCNTGENYRVEAFQEIIDLGLDFNNAHVQPTGAYHYHGTPTSVIDNLYSGEDLVHIGFAHDGFPMYYSKSNTYKPSYKLVDGSREGEDCTYTNPKKTINISIDGHHNGTYTSDFEYVEGSGDLDECNGIFIENQYMYIVTNEFPYVSRCLMGEVSQQERNGPGVGQRDRPSATQILDMMDIDNDGRLSQKELKGPLKTNFSKIDVNKDGFITKEELEKRPMLNKQRL